MFEENPNFFITQNLKEKGIQVLGYSDIGKSMNSFNEYTNYEIVEGLFSFLIENNLNRYLFNVILRLGTLDVNNLSFNMELLKPNFIQNTVKESFIKKFECKNCEHILFREHINEIDYRKVDIKKCPICDKLYEFGYHDLEEDYTINRNDLIKFFNRLSYIGVIKRKLKWICQTCKKEEEFNNNPESVMCKCGDNRELLYHYDFANDFLTLSLKLKDGRWFEWFVFKICEHIYENADHNLLISFDKAGIKKECEIDIIAFDKNELIVFECKDYLKNEVGFGQMEQLPTLSSLFDNVVLVSSHKIKKNSMESIKDLCGKEIHFIEGLDLENQFISQENVLKIFLEDSVYKAISLYQKLSEIKKDEIAKVIISKVLDSKSRDERTFSALTRIIWDTKSIDITLGTQNEDIKKIVRYSIDNIKEDISVYESIDFIRAVHHRIANKLVLSGDYINDLMDFGSNYLTENPSEGYTKRRPFYYFYCSLFSDIDINVKLELNIVKKFLNKFIPMLDVYYGVNSRKSTLNVIRKLWNFMDNELKEKLISKVSTILISDTYITSELIDILTDNISSFSRSHQTQIKEFFNHYISLNKTYKDYVSGALLKI